MRLMRRQSAATRRGAARALRAAGAGVAGSLAAIGGGGVQAEVVGSCRGGDEPSSSSFDADLLRHLEAVSSRDFETYVSTIAEDLVIVLPNGALVDGEAAAIELHRAWFRDDGWRWTPTILRCDVGDRLASALVIYQYREAPEAAAKRSYLSLQFRLTEGRWLLFFDQNTPVDQEDLGVQPTE
ncbi:MAG: YybH family protein [Parvularculaceae bacterium]